MLTCPGIDESSLFSPIPLLGTRTYRPRSKSERNENLVHHPCQHFCPRHHLVLCRCRPCPRILLVCDHCQYHRLVHVAHFLPYCELFLPLFRHSSQGRGCDAPGLTLVGHFDRCAAFRARRCLGHFWEPGSRNSDCLDRRIRRCCVHLQLARTFGRQDV